jgi:hypothetical protein
VKIYLQRKAAGAFLTSYGGWTAERELARVFENGFEAVKLAISQFPQPEADFKVIYHFPGAEEWDFEAELGDEVGTGVAD